MRKGTISVILSDCLIIGVLLGCGVKETYIPDSTAADELVDDALFLETMLDTEISYRTNED